MRHRLIPAIVAMAFIATAGTAIAQELYFYPAQQQSQDQQNRDFGECHGWAIQQSGFDPMAQQAQPQQQATQGGVLQGAGRGAVTGLVVGAIAGDAGKGAAIGAAGGGLIGGFRRRDQERQIQANQQQYQQQQSAGRNSYNRALAACMQGRGYSVS